MIIAYLPLKGWEARVAPYMQLLQVPVTATFGLLAVFVCFSIGYDLGQRLKQEAIVSASMATLVFLMISLKLDDLTLNMDQRPFPILGDRLQISGLVGGNIYSQDAASLTGNGSTIVIPDYFNLGNFATQTVSANLTTQRRLLGAYSSLDFNWSDYAFLTLTGRNDWSSTLPTNAIVCLPLTMVR
jgi:hypothetical protein